VCQTPPYALLHAIAHKPNKGGKVRLVALWRGGKMWELVRLPSGLVQHFLFKKREPFVPLKFIARFLLKIATSIFSLSRESERVSIYTRPLKGQGQKIVNTVE
jgi:hypothetical protein